MAACLGRMALSSESQLVVGTANDVVVCTQVCPPRLSQAYPLVQVSIRYYFLVVIHTYFGQQPTAVSLADKVYCNDQSFGPSRPPVAEHALV